MASGTVTISKETVNRLAKDIKALSSDPLHSHGIYYEHSDTDLLVGRAMIIGAEGTPYDGGYYFFRLDFPCDYPHAPPKVTFLTNGGDRVRMHPNLYRDGKTCLSMLNTWHGQSVGDRWTGCQTIASVLLTISSILTRDPLLHEPGVTAHHADFEPYTSIVEYMNTKLAVVDILSGSSLPSGFEALRAIAREHCVQTTARKRALLDAVSAKFAEQYGEEKKTLTTAIYRNVCSVDYATLPAKLETLIEACKIDSCSK